VKNFDWSELKDAQLKAERGIGFEEIVAAIESGNILEDKEHHNKTRYPNQRIWVVKMRNYAYVVPYVEDDTKYLLKTIIPSRDATKKHLKKGNES